MLRIVNTQVMGTGKNGELARAGFLLDWAIYLSRKPLDFDGWLRHGCLLLLLLDAAGPRTCAGLAPGCLSIIRREVKWGKGEDAWVCHTGNQTAGRESASNRLSKRKGTKPLSSFGATALASGTRSEGLLS